MNYICLSVISSSIGTIAIILIYIYLYVLYRERYMGIWAIGWLLLLSRYVILDLGIFPWKQSLLGTAVYQTLIISSVLLFAWATHCFINKPIHKWWIYGTTLVYIISIMMTALGSSLMHQLLLPIYFACSVCIWIGITFIRHIQLQGIGNYITGYSYIFWSLLNLAAPLAISGSWFLPWAHALGGILRLFIAIGTLMVYFENTRRDVEAQYRLLAENAADIIYSYQILPKAKIKYISPSILLLTGHSPEDYYADNTLIFDLIHPNDRCLLEDFIRHFPNFIESPLTLRLVQKDKTVLWIEHKCTPVYDKNDNIVTLQGIIRDITTRKNLEKISSMLDRMNMVGSMAATVAHEIRNPMTTVRGYLQLMGKRETYQADKDKIKLMIEEMDRANLIIREYLSLSREKIANLKKCSLNAIIEGLFPLIQADANSSKVFVSLDLAPIPDLLLDDNEIRQMLLNLVRNSIEAMPEGGNLVIHTLEKETKTVLSISDQGTGIPSHILDSLGTPFITTKDTGTGLGLPICYQIVHRHNADIKVTTSHKGTTFLIAFTPPAL